MRFRLNIIVRSNTSAWPQVPWPIDQYSRPPCQQSLGTSLVNSRAEKSRAPKRGATLRSDDPAHPSAALTRSGVNRVWRSRTPASCTTAPAMAGVQQRRHVPNPGRMVAGHDHRDVHRRNVVEARRRIIVKVVLLDQAILVGDAPASLEPHRIGVRQHSVAGDAVVPSAKLAGGIEPGAQEERHTRTSQV